MSSDAAPFLVQHLRQTDCVRVRRFSHQPGIELTDSEEEAAKRFQLNVVERGCFTLGFQRRQWALGPGRIFLSRPGDTYRYSHVRHFEPDTCLTIEFSESFTTELREAFGSLSLVLPITNRLAFLRLQLYAQAAGENELVLDTIACELLNAAYESCNDHHRLYRPESLKWYSRKIVAVRELMDADPAGQHSLSRISKQVAMSPFLLARVFRELTGIPPHKYLILRRLKRAHDLLESGMSVTDTCYNVGFNNLSHFVRTFYKHFGLLPSAVKGSKTSR